MGKVGKEPGEFIHQLPSVSGGGLVLGILTSRTSACSGGKLSMFLQPEKAFRQRVAVTAVSSHPHVRESK